LIQRLEDGSHRPRGQRLSPVPIAFPMARRASLTARTTAGETIMDLLLEEMQAPGIETGAALLRPA